MERDPIVVSKWRGRDNYECVACPFASLDRSKVVVHLKECHPSLVSGKPRVLPKVSEVKDAESRTDEEQDSRPD